MISDRKLEANRRNAQKATGPRTPAGKARSAQNATVHGMFARDLLASGESEQELVALRRQLIDYLRPQNVLEFMIVQRLVANQWKLLRLQAAEAKQLAAEGKAAREQALEQSRRLTKIIKFGPERYHEDFGVTREQWKAEHTAERDELANEASGAPPASAMLARTFARPESALQRMSMYEQRLERAMIRAIRELERLRPGIENPSELPTSPYSAPMAAPQDPPAEEQKSESCAHENVRNEPTEPASSMSSPVDLTSAELPAKTRLTNLRDCHHQKEKHHATHDHQTDV